VHIDHEGDTAGGVLVAALGRFPRPGDTVHIGGIGAITVKAYTKNTDIDAPQDLSEEQDTLTISEADYFNFAVDDVDVLCLADVYRLTKASAGPFTTFRFAGGRRIVLPTAEGRAATLELMKEHRITHEASSDVLAAAGGAVGSPP
jgi:hypothetical protein